MEPFMTSIERLYQKTQRGGETLAPKAFTEFRGFFVFPTERR